MWFFRLCLFFYIFSIASLFCTIFTLIIWNLFVIEQVHICSFSVVLLTNTRRKWYVHPVINMQLTNIVLFLSGCVSLSSAKRTISLSLSFSPPVVLKHLFHLFQHIINIILNRYYIMKHKKNFIHIWEFTALLFTLKNNGNNAQIFLYLPLSISLTFFHSHCLSVSLSLSFSLAVFPLSLYLSLSLSLCLSLSLSIYSSVD